MTTHPLRSHSEYNHRREQRAISRVAIIVSWNLLLVGIVLGIAGQPSLAGLAILGAAAAGIGAVGSSPANALSWVTAAASGLALIGVLGASVVLAALHA